MIKMLFDDGDPSPRLIIAFLILAALFLVVAATAAPDTPPFPFSPLSVDSFDPGEDDNDTEDTEYDSGEEEMFIKLVAVARSEFNCSNLRSKNLCSRTS